MTSSALKFRNTFRRPDINIHLVSWYPGHMSKGMKQMQRKLASVDCVIEVHDARIPFSGRNPKFYETITAIRPHILVLNKMDLSDLAKKEKIVEQLKQDNRITNVLFTNSKDSSKGNVQKILPLAIELMQNANTFRQAYQTEYNMMVIGVPNVGKSSLINRLRNLNMGRKNANPVGAKPGITRSVLEKVKIWGDPPVFLFDTPGIMTPHIKNLEIGLRLAACATLNDSLVGEELIADYILFLLNKHENFSYVSYLGIPAPVDDGKLLLLQLCGILKKSLTIRSTENTLVKIPDYKYAARYFLSAFREGKFGKMLLDEI